MANHCKKRSWSVSNVREKAYSTPVESDKSGRRESQPAIAAEKIIPWRPNFVEFRWNLSSNLTIDIHTHLSSPALGKLSLWGIDELLTYHYLEAELFRSSDIAPEKYWSLSKPLMAAIFE
jgi:hypothetical protein